MGAGENVNVSITASATNVKAGFEQAASTVQSSAQQMGDAVKNLGDTSSGIFSSLISNLKSFAQHHQEELAKAGSDVTSFKAAFIGAFAGAALTGVVVEFGDKISEAVKHVAEFGEQLEKASQKT